MYLVASVRLTGARIFCLRSDPKGTIEYLSIVPIGSDLKQKILAPVVRLSVCPSVSQHSHGQTITKVISQNT